MRRLAEPTMWIWWIIVVTENSWVRINDGILFKLHCNPHKINIKEMKKCQSCIMSKNKFIWFQIYTWSSLSTAKKKEVWFSLFLANTTGEKPRPKIIPIYLGTWQLFTSPYISWWRCSVSLNRKWLFWIGGLLRACHDFQRKPDI